MTQINGNYNNQPLLKYSNPNFGNGIDNQSSAIPQAELPDIYYSPSGNFEKKSFKEAIKNNFGLSMLCEFTGIEHWIESPLLMLGTTASLFWGYDKFNQKFSGDYDKSIIGKATKLGDKISGLKIFNTDTAHNIADGYRSGKERVRKFLFKNDAIKAMFTTPGMPEWTIAKSEMLPREQRLLENFNRIVSELGLSSANAEAFGVDGAMRNMGKGKFNLFSLGLDKQEIKYLKDTYKDKSIKSLADSEEAINRILLQRLNFSEDRITEYLAKDNASEEVREELRKALGFTKDELENIVKNPHDVKAKDILAKLEGKNLKAFRICGGHLKNTGIVQPFERQITMESVFNNLKGILDPNISKAGKFMAGSVQTTQKALTFGGGKFCLLFFIAPIFARAIKNTHKADKDQKVGTFTHDVISGTAWVATFPLGMKIMHALGGMQYAGMTQADVAEYRNALEELQRRNLNGEFATKKAYKESPEYVKAKELLKRGSEGQSLFTKICKGLGKFLEIGNENTKGWMRPNGNKLHKWIRKKGLTMKDCVGAPMRFILFLMGIQAVLDGVITKCCNGIFGKNYDDMKAEEHKDAKKEIYSRRFTTTIA